MSCGHHEIKVTPRVFSNGTRHLERRCVACKKHLGYQPHSGNKAHKRIHFGKYKGQTFKWIAENDPSYLEWMRNQPWAKKDLINAINGVLPKTEEPAYHVPNKIVEDAIEDALSEVKKMRSMGLEYFTNISTT